MVVYLRFLTEARSCTRRLRDAGRLTFWESFCKNHALQAFNNGGPGKNESQPARRTTNRFPLKKALSSSPHLEQRVHLIHMTKTKTFHTMQPVVSVRRGLPVCVGADLCLHDITVTRAAVLVLRMGLSPVTGSPASCRPSGYPGGPALHVRAHFSHRGASSGLGPNSFQDGR